MTNQDLIRAIRYGSHSSATKETAFVGNGLVEQSREVHITLFPLRKILPEIW